MVVLVKKRTYRSFPVFFTYQGWSLFSGILCIFAVSLNPADYMRFYAVNMALDALLQFAVLTEMGRVVAAHNHNSPPRLALRHSSFQDSADFARSATGLPAGAGLVESPAFVPLARFCPAYRHRAGLLLYCLFGGGYPPYSSDNGHPISLDSRGPIWELFGSAIVLAPEALMIPRKCLIFLCASFIFVLLLIGTPRVRWSVAYVAG